VLRGSLVRRRDSEEQAFLEGTRDEIDADRKPCCDRADKASAVTFASAIPYFSREPCGYGDHRKALLTES
jgi:hypothetical protein